MNKVDSKLVEVKALYSELVDYFMIKDQDMRIKSEKFFEFFKGVINNVQKSMPKIVEPKKKKKEEMISAIKTNFEKKIKE